eukprot:4470512-Pleurochrysis_carterae.AAC.2
MSPSPLRMVSHAAVWIAAKKGDLVKHVIEQHVSNTSNLTVMPLGICAVVNARAAASPCDVSRAVNVAFGRHGAFGGVCVAT